MSQKKTHHIRTQDKIIRKLLSDSNKKASKVDDDNFSEHEIFHEDFTMQELYNAISKIKVNKSPGPDNIFAEFIIHMGNNARSTLLRLCNHIWNSTVPSQWKKATIIPILKKNKSPKELENFRPGVFNPRPVGRMRPSGEFCAAREGYFTKYNAL